MWAQQPFLCKQSLDNELDNKKQIRVSCWNPNQKKLSMKIIIKLILSFMSIFHIDNIYQR